MRTKIHKFLSITGIKPAHFILPIALSFTAALFDGISIGLLVPLGRGVIGMDFGFVQAMPIFKAVISNFPQIFIYTANPNSSIFLMLMIIIFISTILKNSLSYLASITAVYQTRQLSKNISNAIFSRYLAFGKLFFDRANIGQLNTILVNFTFEASLLINHLRDFLSAIFTMAIYFVIMCVISWKLAIFIILLFPALYYSIDWIAKNIKRTSASYAESRIHQAWKNFDILTCLPLVKSYAREKAEGRNFFKLSNSIARLQFASDRKVLLIGPIQEMVVTTTLLLIISVMAFMFVKGQAGTISGFLVFFYIFRKCAPLFNSLNSFKAHLAEADGPIKSIAQIFDDTDKFFVPEGTMKLETLKGRIEFRHLNFSYGDNRAVLKDISFLVEKGKVTAIVGPTGSGKTTLINLILRFYDCPADTIFVDGIDIRNYTSESLRSKIALVSQDTLLFNDTIGYNIMYGYNGDMPQEKLIEAVKKARLYDFIMTLPNKFDTFIGDRGIKLSGGERQRLSIARAFFKGSEILILDESTSSLDTKTERLIQEAIEETIKGKTTIVIAHRLSTIRYADKIIVIEDGRLVEEGPLDGLLNKKEKFHEYWEAQKFY